MLVDYAAEYTQYNMRSCSQFLISTEWNLRNLSLSVGDGGPVTLFAANNDGFNNVIDLEDVNRLATDKWKPHMWDLMLQNLVQGIYLDQDLRDLYTSNGGEYNLTSLTGQNITIDYDKTKDVILVGGGEVIYKDIKGVDG
jgi:uncharacterized surface protein with fasciclin (FAS1) repeats